MAQQNRTTLKGFFETGDTPTEAQFIDLIDSNHNIAEDGTPATAAQGALADSALQSADFAPVHSAATTVVFDNNKGGRVYNATTPSSAATVTLDFTGAVDGGMVKFWSDGTEVTIDSGVRTVYLGGSQKTGEAGTLFLLYDAQADNGVGAVTANWVPSANTSLLTMQQPTLAITAGEGLLNYVITNEDAVADGGELQYKLTSEPTTWTTWGSYSFGVNAAITGLTNGLSYDVRFRNTTTDVTYNTNSPYSATQTETPVAAPAFNTKSASYNGTTSQVVSDAQVSVIDFQDTVNDLPFSVSLWEKLGTTTATQPMVCSYINAGDFIWNLVKYASNASGNENKYLFQMRDGSNATVCKTLTGYTSTDWRHIVMTYDGSGLVAGVKFYVDGSLVNADNTQNSYAEPMVAQTTSHRLGIGFRNPTVAPNNRLQAGLIDEVAIFSSELNATDVTNIYNSGTPNDLTAHAKAADLETYVRFEDSVTDLSTNSIALTGTDIT